MPITYGDLSVSLVLGRGIVVNEAPEYAKISVSLLANNQFGLTVEQPGRIKIGYQVEYEVASYDPDDATLTLRLVRDWRPGQKDDPNPAPATPEPDSHLD